MITYMSAHENGHPFPGIPSYFLCGDIGSVECRAIWAIVLGTLVDSRSKLFVSGSVFVHVIRCRGYAVYFFEH